MSATTYFFVENYDKYYADTFSYQELCRMKNPFRNGKSWSYDSGVVLFPSDLNAGLLLYYLMIL